ncbi:MAG TPA: O-antigen ligase family protein [Flavobacteriaceae bacterium]|nr:O-antigen ligase family protein [Flavobacteriaceae bacterium]
MKAILKYTLLVLLLFKLDTFSLIAFGETIGSIASALFFGGIVAYFFLAEKVKPVIILVVLGVFYHFISALKYSGPTQEFIISCIKYFLFVLLISSLAKNTKKNEIILFLFLGALSILINAVFFSNPFGRYSGFYVNPNTAGAVVLIGYVFCLSVKNSKLRLLLQFGFIICGLMTLSRYFILLLVIITLLSIVYNKHNLIGAVFGALAMLFVITSGDFKLNTDRFNALQSIFSNDVDTETITKESRDETWALYQKPLLNNLLTGNGYKSFQGHEYDTVGVQVGVHNSYLMILGESGILAFLTFVYLYVLLIIKSITHFFKHPEYLYLSIVLFTYLLVSHVYFENYIILFFTIWLYQKLNNTNMANPETTLES